VAETGRKAKNCCGDPRRAVPAHLVRVTAWQRLEARLHHDVFRWARRRRGDAWVDSVVASWADDGGLAESEISLLTRWSIHEFPFEGSVAAQQYAQVHRDRLADDERGWFEAHARARLSVWSVLEVDEDGARVRIRDLVTGDERWAQDLAVDMLEPGQALLARIAEQEGWSVVASAHPATLGEEAARAVIGSARPEAARLFRTWAAMVRVDYDIAGRVVEIEDSFELLSVTRAEAVAAVATLPGVEVEEDEGNSSVIGLYSGEEDASGDRTLDAQIEVTTSEIVVWTFSFDSADEIRARIEQLLGARIAHRERVTERSDHMEPSE
ncbi:MAG TPA: hypothetical protein VLQ79_05475, partial [Myxococcaceae bacterium]|nr:hypothetical protein [Myxococcaceae bacterium]